MFAVLWFVFDMITAISVVWVVIYLIVLHELCLRCSDFSLFM